MRVAVLGGGVAGVVVASELSRSSAVEVDLYEQNTRLGGLHHSVEVDGLHYDIGAFLFDREHALIKAFPFLRPHFHEVDHRSLVMTQSGSLDIYPMSMRGYIEDHSVGSLIADGISLLRSKIRDRRKSTLPEYVHYYLGPRVYEQSGLKAYIERFYAVPHDEVDLEFALQRLDALPERCSLRRNAGRMARESFDRSVAEKTWGCYVRPEKGFGAVYTLIEEHLRSQGVAITYGAGITRVEKREQKYIIYRDDVEPQEYDLIVSTIPVGIMMRLIGRTMAKPPTMINLLSLCYRFNGDLGFSNAGMLYNFTDRHLWKRLTLFSDYYGPAPNGDHYFVVECTHRADDPTTAEELAADFEKHVDGLPIFNGELRYLESIFTRNAYPFLSGDDLASVATAKAELNDFGVAMTGRQGGFRYMTSHMTALAAQELARSLQEIGEEEEALA